jgi:glutamate decarboxylase
MGMVLFKDENDLDNLKHYSNYIIRQDSVDQGRYSLEGSRAFSALKPWATFKILGSNGFRLLFEHAFELTSVLRGLVEVHCNFESINQPELFIFNYRFVPKDVRAKIASILLKIGRDGQRSSEEKERLFTRIARINRILNELNIELHKALRDEDNSFVSRTTYDVPQYFYQDIVVLRTITINPLTTPEILKEIINQQDRLGRKIYKTEFQTRLLKI